MPRRAPEIDLDIPLYLVPHFVARGIKRHAEEVDEIIIEKTHRHFYNVSIRTRRIRKELKSGSSADRKE